MVEYSREGDKKHTSCPDMGTDQFLELNPKGLGIQGEHKLFFSVHSFVLFEYAIW